ncbi:MAG: UDP-N-acetylglucosamine diphosphorylase/glucosamine-1-phosphate N-acetyltransferase [Bdellovibrionales bacterium RIFOXYB1_FULL_37_110]|nr:MAG: UDP-N-acetylglucosamine diphosphorylase/glucosamine-1-phosphate N-acetyltransferase [Bdellovibrionales bacterium RIFOXYA1_FULL_38_20]OFZ47812.1 MAG: UDP-N-acetylglucosamine diphosphorylase/glucosamine-1-phosphate N-acetyltransferase [Bdellovibrionales bacterium RIFOXYC1_FULL_37_79]OFZ57559.1 MAG: UDP-N-acetylglucosamine diphosphorylase/glucosamine-1-phosphate N-acetyltransferase [Bdellovibrionales bacterium RIFOXYB1_FULL_37_110]OFZ61627.1 MAG: UDP-N-acetylglucosamine diphosphorylase/gluc
MKKTIGIVILAAGQGKRMGTDTPKPLLIASGKRLIDFPINEAKMFCEKSNLSFLITAVTGHKRELVNDYLAHNFQDVATVFQKEQLGTADAIRSYFDQQKSGKQYDYTLILCADTPLIRSIHLSFLWKSLLSQNLDAVAATFIADDPAGYGRILRGEKGFKIVEHKDATEEQKIIDEVNSGLYIMKTDYLVNHLEKIDANNMSKEFYLTDVFKEEANVAPILFDDYKSFVGVNNPDQLEEVYLELNYEKIYDLKKNGVFFYDSACTYVDWDVEVGAGSIIYPQVSLRGKSVIGKNVVIDAGSIIKDSRIDDHTVINPYSIVDKSHIGKSVAIGPFARIRPDTEVGESSKIGNFVETKKAILRKGVKVSHLSYVGDAIIGEDTNIGCGFITCNYDGANKHLTEIGKGCFIGSDSQMIAPVKIGDNCYVASGSTINKNMADGDFAIARSVQENKPGLARKFIKKKDK